MIDLLQEVRARPSIHTVSFDVFDTILFRKHGSWRVLLGALGQHLIERGLLSSHVTADFFVMIRLEAEAKAHRIAADRKVYAVPLVDIYDAVPRQYLHADASSAKLAQEEFAFEKDAAYALPVTLKVLNDIDDLGKRICFTSNTYFRREELREILLHIGVPERCAENIFCSCEYKRPKQRGLYLDVLDSLKIAPHNMLHCGDNYDVDIRGAKKYDVPSFHYKGTVERWLTDYQERSKGVISDVLRQANPFDADKDAFRAFGYAVLGPIAAGFVCWLLQLARQTDHTRLLFAEREGLFFRRLMDRLLVGTKVEDVGTDTIAVSRKSVLPLIADSDEIGMKIDAFERQLKLGIEALQTDVTPEEISSANAYFSKKLGVGSVSDGKTLFVDIGYKGTINSYLNVYLKAVGVAPMAGAYLFHTGTSFREAYSSYGYLSEHNLPVDILSRSMKGVSFLEQCFMPDTGSVIGYDETASPVRDRALLSQKQLDEQGKVQAGIEAFMDDLLEICTHLDLGPSEALQSRESMAEELLNLFQMPSTDVQDIALSWRHEINFGSKTVIPISATSILGLVGPCDKRLRTSKCWTGPLWNSGYFNLSEICRKPLCIYLPPRAADR